MNAGEAAVRVRYVRRELAIALERVLFTQLDEAKGRAAALAGIGRALDAAHDLPPELAARVVIMGKALATGVADLPVPERVRAARRRGR